VARFRRQVRDAIERLDRQSAFISRLRSQAKISPQDELALNALSDRDPHHQAPLFQLYEQSSQMALGDLDSLLQARNTKVAATRPQSGSASSDDEDGEEEDGEEEEEEEEDGEGEAEPRWKEARREKRKRARSAKRSSKGGESEDESDEEAPERAEGKRGKKKGKGAKVRVGACLSAPLLASLSLCLSVCVCARARPPAPALACVCISLRTRTHNVSMTGGCAPRAHLQRRRPSCAPPKEVRTSEPLLSLARSQRAACSAC